jgi:hypothetical protein
MKKFLAIVAVTVISMFAYVPAKATDFTTTGWQTGFTATITSQGLNGSGNYVITATWTHNAATLLSSGTPAAGQLANQGQRVLQCDSSSITFTLNNISAPAGCSNITSTRSSSLSGNVLTVTFTISSSDYAAKTKQYLIPDTWWADSATGQTANTTAGNDLVVPTTGTGDSSGSQSGSNGSSIPSPKIPQIREFDSGSLLITPGSFAKLTGSRLNCTTSVSVNDKPTTFTYQSLPSGEGQLSIAIPNDLALGKHRLAMNSCGGNVVYENILMVSKPAAKLELTMATGIERGLALVKLRAFVRENRADYNTVECVADAANPTQKKHATQLVDRFCKRAISLLASPKEHSTLLRSENQQNSIKLTVTLSNR